MKYKHTYKQTNIHTTTVSDNIILVNKYIPPKQHLFVVTQTNTSIVNGTGNEYFTSAASMTPCRRQCGSGHVIDAARLSLICTSIYCFTHCNHPKHNKCTKKLPQSVKFTLQPNIDFRFPNAAVIIFSNQWTYSLPAS